VKPRPSNHEHDSPRTIFDPEIGAWYLLAVELWNADYEQLRKEFPHVIAFIDYMDSTANSLIRSASQS
jgi:hypothetical protein